MQIHGQIKDKNTGESLPGANVYFSDQNGKITDAVNGRAADLNGNYTLTGEGQYITASYTGYNPKTKQANNGLIDFQLSAGVSLPEVNIVGTIWWPRILAAIVVLLVLWYIIKSIS